MIATTLGVSFRGVAARIVLAGGRRAFVKAVAHEPNRESPEFHRREAWIIGALPVDVPAPRLLWTLDEGGDETLVREPALRAAARATLVLEQTANLSVSLIVVQVRATAVDLLRGSGLARDEAERQVREAARLLA